MQNKIILLNFYSFWCLNRGKFDYLLCILFETIKKKYIYNSTIYLGIPYYITFSKNSRQVPIFGKIVLSDIDFKERERDEGKNRMNNVRRRRVCFVLYNMYMRMKR